MTEKIKTPDTKTEQTPQHEQLSDTEKQALISTLQEFSRFQRQAESPGAEGSSDKMIAQTFESSMENAKNPKVRLLIEAAASGAMRDRSQAERIDAAFFEDLTNRNADSVLRGKIDNFHSGAQEARQYPDGQEAIAQQGIILAQDCLQELENPTVDAAHKDILLATAVYSATQSGPGSPAEQLTNQALPKYL